ncbi:unnamed protein product [Rotaria sordida]|uniref:G-protein coupled receptors family 1 profile domain-containing protein n=1 Tax=Rotaria sordida TaxID=392033 RepID=A0A814LKA8_9BILA|nr:unnamed protein product [Rotaria sordida]CAF1009821.1 unnamed protein product [Rotaria sordida]CAF1066940.1 unnamed protein product [Rotaria sordida]CAF3589109.1 unnamed protein product [Rotaria sordida]
MSSNTTIITSLTVVSAQLNRYLSIVILLFGVIGNILNCLVLSERTLRSNPCVLLFLASSIASLITLISGIAVRLLSGWSMDLTDTVEWICKFRIFILFSSRTIASWLIVMATIDRWLSSSINVHLRHMSTIKNARRGIIIIICLSIIVYIQIFYCYQSNLIDSPLKCYGKTKWCRILNDFEFAFISVIIPSLLMFIFGLMTILRIRQTSLRRIQPIMITTFIQTKSKNQRSQTLRKTDHYLLAMLFMQVLLLTLFSLPQVIVTLYSNINLNINQIKSPLDITINQFIFNLFILLTYVTNGMPFYIYTLTGGTVFRKALLKTLTEFIRKFIFSST